jgi:hypothetical protein
MRFTRYVEPLPLFLYLDVYINGWVIEVKWNFLDYSEENSDRIAI